MLEHLINADFEPTVCETTPEGLVRLEPTSNVNKSKSPEPGDILDAQVVTAKWMDEAGLTEETVQDEVNAAIARDAFHTLTTATSTEAQNERLLALRMPQEVQHLVGMLTAYDWEFVHQAKQIRGFVVSKLMTEAETAAKAGDRIKALTALGKVTEVGLFTEKVEVKQAAHTDEELDARIKERIAKLRGVQNALTPATDIQDASAKPVTD